MDLRIGELVLLGYNGAKLLGAENVAYEEVRIEASGHDWVVVRDSYGRSYACSFTDNQLQDIRETLRS